MSGGKHGRRMTARERRLRRVRWLQDYRSGKRVRVRVITRIGAGCWVYAGALGFPL